MIDELKSPNHSVERTGASHLAQLQIVCQWRLLNRRLLGIRDPAAAFPDETADPAILI